MNAQRCLRLRTTFPPPIRLRNFHSTRPNHFFAEVVGAGFTISKFAFTSIHSATGLSWAVSIPLTAAAFRILWLPVMYLTMKNQEKQKAWSPMLLAWRKVYQDQVMRQKDPSKRPSSPEEAEEQVQNNLKARRKFFRKKYKMMSGVTSFGLQFSFLPIWFINAAQIRVMAATPEDRDQTSHLFAAPGQEEHVRTLMDTAQPAEPGFLLESPLWLVDLVAPDSTGLLPIAFGALMWANIHLAAGRNRDEQRRDVMAMPAGLARNNRLLLMQFSEMLSLWALVCPYFLIKAQTPAAVVLYLVGSAATQLVSRPIVARAVGYQATVSPAIIKEPVLKNEYRTGTSLYTRDSASMKP